MIQTLKTPRFLVLSLLIVAAAATRALPLVVPHMWHFTAVGALAIFAGAQFTDKRLAFSMPLAAMALSDVFIGNGFSAAVYAGFVAMVCCGILISKRQTIGGVFTSSVLGAVVFYLITNFAFLYPTTLYPHSAAGVIASYIAGLPFLNNMIAGNLIYSTILFGSFSLLSKKYPSLAN